MKPSPPVLSLSQVFIIAFCLFHIAAVAVYSLPDAARDSVTNALRTLQPYVRPYILLTSQWQQWNLFSPDPLRRTVTYAVEREQQGMWAEIAVFDPRSVSIFRHATEFKFLGRLLEGGKDQLPLIEHFLRAQCDAHLLPSGTHLRLVYRHAMIPVPGRALTPGEWAGLSLPVESFVGSEILCGWPTSTSLLRTFP